MGAILEGDTRSLDKGLSELKREGGLTCCILLSLSWGW